ncbi:MAG: PAAR domain-containing protein [Polyangiaceae bacterium]|nr:PAAR domain-containing protein [Polyangiaceae bacterium]
MPAISTRVDLCRGHDACAPRPFADHSPDVRAEGFEVTREDDSLVSHGCPDHSPHGARVIAGFPTVTANGKRVAYVGASVDCPSEIVDTGRPTVLLNEGTGGAALHGKSGAAKGTQTDQPPVRGGKSNVKSGTDKGGYNCRGRVQYTQQTPATCGIASMRMIINGTTSQNVTEQQVARTANGLEAVTASGQSWGPVYASSQGSFIQGLPGVLNQYGVQSYSEPPPAAVDADYINRITANGTKPAIVMIYGSKPGIGHLIVVDGVDKNGNVMVRNPGRAGAQGCQTFTMAELNGRLYPGQPVVILGNPPQGYQPPVTVRPRAK